MNSEKSGKKRGFFITFEGPEGAGKSTQVAMLLDFLKKNNRPAVTTREPGGTALAEKIREVVKGHDGNEKIPVTADGSAHFVSCAMPIMSEGDIIGCVASLCPMNGERGTEQTASDIESKLVLTAAGFLGKQLEG